MAARRRSSCGLHAAGRSLSHGPHRRRHRARLLRRHARPARGHRPGMSAAELFGLIVVGRCSVGYLALRAAARGAALDDRCRAGSRSRSSSAVLTALTPLLGALHGRVYTGERGAPDPRARAGRALHLPRCCAPTPRAGQDWKGYARTALVFSALFFVALYADPAHPGRSIRSTREDFGSAPWDVSFNTAPSFVTNTNWQYYGGETTMSYFSPDGRPGGPELRLGRRRHGRAGRGDPRPRRRAGQRARQLLGRPDARAAVHPAADLDRRRRWCSSPRARCRRSRPTSTFAHAHRRRADARARPGRARRRRSRSSARTAAASSTSTRRCRSRTPTGSRTSSRCC